MMRKVLHELASVVSKDNILWLVHGIVEDRILCRPKYLDAENYKGRLHSPIFDSTHITTNYLPYDTTGVYSSLFLLDETDILEYRLYDNDLGSSVSKTASAAREFIRELQSFNVNPSKIGYIGSLLWRREVDGYSDVNLIIQGDDAYLQYSTICESIPELHFRDENDWRDFYFKYSVKGIEIDEFVKFSKKNVLQGFFSGIPFTIHHIRDVLPEYQAMTPHSKEVELNGVFVSCYRTNGYYPIRGMLNTPNDSLYIIIWSRFWPTVLPLRCHIRVSGKLNGNQLIVGPCDRIIIDKDIDNV